MSETDSLHVSVQVSGDMATLEIAGEVDVFSVRQLADGIRRATALGAAIVSVDLSGVTFMDARGIAALVEGSREAQEQGRELVLHRLSPPVERMYRLTKMSASVLPVT